MEADPVGSTSRLGVGDRSLAAAADSIPGAEESRTGREEDRRQQDGRCSSLRQRREEGTAGSQQAVPEADSRDRRPDALAEGMRVDHLAICRSGG